MSEFTLALKTRISAVAIVARTRTPFEKTSRSPRLVNCRGKNPSRAMIAASRGKPWYEVFAARIRIPNVNTWTIQNMKCPAEPVGKVALAISDRTDTDELGRASIWTARYDTPRKRTMAMDAIVSSVFAALDAWGFLKAVTPFAIASTPVSALEPEAKARSNTNAVTAPVPA